MWFYLQNSFMKMFLYTFIIWILLSQSVYATVMQGGVSQSDMIIRNKVIDKYSKLPIQNAKVRIPSKNYTTYTDKNGEFLLGVQTSSPMILSVEKENYKPFSVTVTRENLYKPFTLSIERSNKYDIKIDSQLCHLGDNNFSSYSANAGQFKGLAVGPIYNKEFIISSVPEGKQNYLVIGSIIGVDTALARGIGQNRITTAFASPPNVYLNGQKIAEIQINGDNQKIKLPHNLIFWNKKNVITIRAGRNLMQTAYIDYDDIEFMNISVQAY